MGHEPAGARAQPSWRSRGPASARPAAAEGRPALFVQLSPNIVIQLERKGALNTGPLVMTAEIQIKFVLVVDAKFIPVCVHINNMKDRCIYLQ